MSGIADLLCSLHDSTAVARAHRPVETKSSSYGNDVSGRFEAHTGVGGARRPIHVTPEQIDLMRRLALNEREATNLVMSGGLADSLPLDERTSALVRIAALLCIDSDPATLHWAAELGLVAGVDDDTVFHALLVVAPIIGVARLGSVLPHLMEALDLEVVD